MSKQIVEQLVESILQNREGFMDEFKAAIAAKVSDALEVRKVEIASTLIAPQQEPAEYVAEEVELVEEANLDHIHDAKFHEERYGRNMKKYMETLNDAKKKGLPFVVQQKLEDLADRHARNAEDAATQYHELTGKKIYDPGYTGNHPAITSSEQVNEVSQKTISDARQKAQSDAGRHALDARVSLVPADEKIHKTLAKASKKQMKNFEGGLKRRDDLLRKPVVPDSPKTRKAGLPPSKPSWYTGATKSALTPAQSKKIFGK